MVYNIGRSSQETLVRCLRTIYFITLESVRDRKKGNPLSQGTVKQTVGEETAPVTLVHFGQLRSTIQQQTRVNKKIEKSLPSIQRLVRVAVGFDISKFSSEL